MCSARLVGFDRASTAEEEEADEDDGGQKESDRTRESFARIILFHGLRS